MFIERRATDKQEVITSHTLADYPKDLHKKVTLLQHFKSYLEGDQNKNSSNPIDKPPESNNVLDPEPPSDNTTNSSKPANGVYVYVKKWMRTRHAIMFRLSNKIVQVCPQDHTEIILSSESRVVTYANKKGDRLSYPLSTALESNNYEMTKCLKYTKDILTHMLNMNQAQQQAHKNPNQAPNPIEQENEIK